MSWYDGHPDVPRTWPLEAEKVAVLGVGNVALDVARILAKTADELLPTEIPPNVYDGLKANKALEVHVFGRRGPAQAKFSPMELRELDHSPNIEVIVDPEDIDYDEGSIATRRANKQADMVAKTLENWAIRDVGDRPHKLFLHFFESPVEVLGEDGKVVGLRTERTAAGRHRQRQGHRRVHGLGRRRPSTARSATSPTKLPKLPWDVALGHRPGRGRPGHRGARRAPAVDVRHRLDPARPGRPDRPHQGRRQRDGRRTCWTTTRNGRLHDAGRARRRRRSSTSSSERGVRYTTWEGWYRLDARGEGAGRAAGPRAREDRRARGHAAGERRLTRRGVPGLGPRTPPRLKCRRG